MENITIQMPAGNTIVYKIVNGTAYHVQTPDEVINILERCRQNKTRIKIYLGNTETGEDWRETFDTTGTIGRSMGKIQVPILLHNSRSMGGGALLDHCIIKISESNGRRKLYEHPKYHL